ncbi:alpha-E domain-containing protein [Flavobacterium sp. RHBU_3]|uniref:alpha-E domain-containing protein n=1 Tax=Flavobacterium sp. RHBU_3 TaxID=3391184 RepID=UPI003984C4D4
MLSRVAENIFWMSRYMERTNIHLRNLQTLYIASQDGLPVISWDNICKEYTNGNGGICGSAGEILQAIVFDSNLDLSLCNNIMRARENARSAQDHITKELWQSLNDFYHQMRNPMLKTHIALYDPISVFDQFIKQCMHYYGTVDNSMFRGEGFFFLRIGGYIERALQCLLLLKRQMLICNTDTDSVDAVSWRYLLISLSGYEYYLQANAGSLDPQSIYAQILFEENFPNSIAHSLNQIASFTKSLKKSNLEEQKDNLEFEIGRSLAFLKYMRPDNTPEQQLNFINELETYIYNIVQAFDRHYFKVVY